MNYQQAPLVPLKSRRFGRSRRASALASQSEIMKFLAVFFTVFVVPVSATGENAELTTILQNAESTTGGSAGLLGACEDAKNPFSGVSNCVFRVPLCKLADYEKEMRKDCPKTCGFC